MALRFWELLSAEKRRTELATRKWLDCKAELEAHMEFENQREAELYRAEQAFAKVKELEAQLQKKQAECDYYQKELVTKASLLQVEHNNNYRLRCQLGGGDHLHQRIKELQTKCDCYINEVVAKTEQNRKLQAQINDLLRRQPPIPKQSPPPPPPPACKTCTKEMICDACLLSQVP
jgi:hypothetical protein